MTDTLTPSERSRVMSRVRAKNTKPELRVRSITHGLGYRYRLHVRDLPGSPDLVFRSRRKVIFVHGCFWHRHPGCHLARLPKSNHTFWLKKLEGNRKRDARHQLELECLGWTSLTIWECELRDEMKIENKIRRFLSE